MEADPCKLKLNLTRWGPGPMQRNPDPYEPCPEVLRVRKMLGLNTERTNEDRSSHL